MNKFAEHIKKYMGKKAIKCARITKKAFTYKDEQAALAKYLNINENDITKNEDNFYFGLPEFTTKSGEQYSISANENVIKGAVAESLENLFDELGFEEFKEKVLPHVGGLENVFSVSESKFYDQAYEELQEVDDIEEPTDEQVEKKQQEIIDSYGSAEEFFIEFGDDYVKLMIDHGDAYMDFEKMAENVINEYGAGHELSSYDNSTEEVEYNGKTYYIFRQAKKTKKMTKKAIENLTEDIKIIDYDNIPENLKGTFSWKELLDAIKREGYEFDKKYYEFNKPLYHIVALKDNKEYEFMLSPNNSIYDICSIYNITEDSSKKGKNKTLADIIRREINKSAGSIDYEVMMDIPQNSNVKKEEIINEIQHLGDTYNLGLEDMYEFQPNHTLTFTLPMEKANKLIDELENLGFRLLKKDKKDNRTQDEWERDQKIYD